MIRDWPNWSGPDDGPCRRPSREPITNHDSRITNRDLPSRPAAAATAAAAAESAKAAAEPATSAESAADPASAAESASERTDAAMPSAHATPAVPPQPAAAADTSRDRVDDDEQHEQGQQERSTRACFPTLRRRRA